MKFYTPEEVAQILGVCKVTILRRVRDGSIRAAKLGPRSIRISEADLNEYIQEAARSDAE